MKLLLAFIFALTPMTPAYAQTSVGAIIDGTETMGQQDVTNYAVNPGFEKPGKIGVVDGGTGSSSVFQRTTISGSVLKGKGSFQFSSATVGHTFTFKFNALDKDMYGKNCQFTQSYRGGGTGVAGYKVYLKQNGTKIAASEQTVTIEDVAVSKTFSFNYPCGNSTSGAFDLVWETSLNSVVAMTVDQTYGGQALNIGTVAQATLFGVIRQDGASGCVRSSSTTSETTWNALATGSGCASISATGSVANSSQNILQMQMTNLAPGAYQFTLSTFFNVGVANLVCIFRFSDGVTSFGTLSAFYNSGNSSAGNMQGTLIVPSSVSSKTIYVEASGTNGNTCQTLNNSAGRMTEWSVHYFPTQSQQAVRMENAGGPTIQKFTSGSGTYTPSAGTTYIEVEMVGGGGGGGGGGVGNNGGTGTAGGSTTLGSIATAGGGAAGSGYSPGIAGTISVSAPATVVRTLAGGTGSWGAFNQSGNYARSGKGGSSPFGGEGGDTCCGGAGDSAKANSGSGGAGGPGGAASNNYAGGGGAGGGYAKFQIKSPSAMSYVVGAGGAGGAAGTSAFAGGAGGSGYIVVTEYYGNNTPLIVGGVTSSSAGLEILQRLTYASGCTLSTSSGSWATVGSNGTGDCAITFTPAFSGTPSCTVSAYNGSDAAQQTAKIHTISASAARVMSYNASASITSYAVQMICVGPR